MSSKIYNIRMDGALYFGWEDLQTLRASIRPSRRPEMCWFTIEDGRCYRALTPEDADTHGFSDQDDWYMFNAVWWGGEGSDDIQTLAESLTVCKGEASLLLMLENGSYDGLHIKNGVVRRATPAFTLQLTQEVLAERGVLQPSTPLPWPSSVVCEPGKDCCVQRAGVGIACPTASNGCGRYWHPGDPGFAELDAFMIDRDDRGE